MEALEIDVEGTGGWRQSEGEERREQRVGDTSPLPLPMLPAHLGWRGPQRARRPVRRQWVGPGALIRADVGSGRG